MLRTRCLSTGERHTHIYFTTVSMSIFTACVCMCNGLTDLQCHHYLSCKTQEVEELAHAIAPSNLTKSIRNAFIPCQTLATFIVQGRMPTAERIAIWDRVSIFNHLYQMTKIFWEPSFQFSYHHINRLQGDKSFQLVASRGEVYGYAVKFANWLPRWDAFWESSVHPI